MRYLDERPFVRFNGRLCDRQQLWDWTDACGTNGRLAAVLYMDKKWSFTDVLVPQHVCAQLTRRGDNQIGILEMLAVLLLTKTFHNMLTRNAVVIYIDNDGVLGTLLKGGGRAPEQNLCAG